MSMEKRDKITLRQLMIIFYMSSLAITIRALPSGTAEIAKGAAWLSTVIAVIPCMLLYWVMRRLFKNSREDDGLVEVFCKILGEKPGKILAMVYFFWVLLIAAASARDFAEQFMMSVYQENFLELFMVTLLALAFFAAKGNLRTFARTSEMFQWILCFIIVAVLLASVSGFDARNIKPITTYDAPALLKSQRVVMNTLSLTMLGGFLGSSVLRDEKKNRTAYRWVFYILMTLTAIQFAVLASLGDQMTAQMTAPFYVMVKNIRIFGVVERFESLVVVAWVVMDFIFLAVMVIICVAILRSVFQLNCANRMVTPTVFLIYAGAILTASNVTRLYNFTSSVLRTGNLILCFGVPIIILVTGKLRKIL